MGCPIGGCALARSMLLAGESAADADRGASHVRDDEKNAADHQVRMGYEDDPDKYVAHDVLPLAREWGAAAATLHGRRDNNDAADWLTGTT